MNAGPAFGAADRRRPSLLDDVSLGAYRPHWFVRESLQHRPWPITCAALLLDRRDGPAALRDVAPDIAAAVSWEGAG
jgi:hypothetical protein